MFSLPINFFWSCIHYYLLDFRLQRTKVASSRPPGDGRNGTTDVGALPVSGIGNLSLGQLNLVPDSQEERIIFNASPGSTAPMSNVEVQVSLASETVSSYHDQPVPEPLVTFQDINSGSDDDLEGLYVKSDAYVFTSPWSSKL